MLITAQDNKYETNTKHSGSGLREISQKSSQEVLPSLRYLSWANFLIHISLLDSIIYESSFCKYKLLCHIQSFCSVFKSIRILFSFKINALPFGDSMKNIFHVCIIGTSITIIPLSRTPTLFYLFVCLILNDPTLSSFFPLHLVKPFLYVWLV